MIDSYGNTMGASQYLTGFIKILCEHVYVFPSLNTVKNSIFEFWFNKREAMYMYFIVIHRLHVHTILYYDCRD